jgi:hypothetical protein
MSTSQNNISDLIVNIYVNSGNKCKFRANFLKFWKLVEPTVNVSFAKLPQSSKERASIRANMEFAML